MNQLVEEFAKKAGFLQHGNGTFSEQDAVKKFAKMIIKKCVDICKDSSSFSSDFSRGRHSAARDIKEQFGIE